MSTKSQASSYCRLLRQTLRSPRNSLIPSSQKIYGSPYLPSSENSQLPAPFSPKPYFSNLLLNDAQRYRTKAGHSFPQLSQKSHFSTAAAGFTESSRVVEDLLAEVEQEKQREREARKRAGLDTKDIDAEDEEDYMGVGPLIEKLEKKFLKDKGDLNAYEEPTDSESDEDDDRFSAEAVQKRAEVFEKKFSRHKELLENFVEAGMYI